MSTFANTVSDFDVGQLADSTMKGGLSCSYSADEPVKSRCRLLWLRADHAIEAMQSGGTTVCAKELVSGTDVSVLNPLEFFEN